MHAGYLVIETNRSRPGIVRILEAASLPAEDRWGDQHREGPRVRYIARFNDLSAGRMDAHRALRRRLMDVEGGLYRCEPLDAVAAVEASHLPHRTAYLDPDLAEDPRLSKIAATRRRRHRLADRIWRAIGVAAVLLLVLKLLFGF
jgi:hypothetical protein